MKKSRFSAEQIVAILNEAAAKETKLAEILCQLQRSLGRALRFCEVTLKASKPISGNP